MVNGISSFLLNFIIRQGGIHLLRCVGFAFVGLVGVFIVGGLPTVVAGPPPDKVPQVAPNNPIEIQIDRYGFEWCVVGDINNQPFDGNRITGGFKGFGSVSYKYRITRTELTTEQYLEFIEVYWPYYDGNPISVEFTGLFIFGSWDGDHPAYYVIPHYERVPATISLRMAARYCNWLQNGKIIEQWAFDTGVYDATTFGWNQDGTPSDDYTRSPDARYWIPNVDEWLKAAYYDPNRFGPGRSSWWDFPNKTDQPLLIGFPAESGEIPIPTQVAREGITGETNGSLDNFPAKGMSVGSYPWVQSPWGLRDVSGGLSEIAFPWEMGSSIFFPEQLIDDLDMSGSTFSYILYSPGFSGEWGLRLASSVPNQIEN